MPIGSINTSAVTAANAANATPARATTLALAAFLSVLAFALYASLRPFTGWSEPVGSPFGYLLQFSNRAVRRWDVILNFFGYVPLALFATLALRGRMGVGRAAMVAFAGLILMSLVVETLQSYLPVRTPSIVDLVVNALGAAAGAVLAILTVAPLDRYGGAGGLRARWLLPGWNGDLTLVLLGGWLFALLAPRTLLFANGDARAALGFRVRFDAPVASFGLTEAAITALSVVALALMVRALTQPQAPQRSLFVGLLLVGMIIRSLGFTLFWSTPFAFAWMTQGALTGVAAGAVIGIALLRIAPTLAQTLAVVALGACVILINISPPDPMLWYKLRVVRGTELGPLSAVARNAAMLWPFAAIALLLLPQTRRAARCA